MALSEKEKDWLERREKYLKLYCQHCQFFEPYDTPHVNPGWCSGDCWCCPVVGKDILYSFQDAAEFNARVAEKLAKPRKELRPKGCSWYETTGGGHLVRKTACARPTTTSTTAPALPCVPSTTPASQPRLRWRLDTGPGLRHGGGTTTHGSVRAAVSKLRASCPAFCAGFSFFSC